MGLNTLKIQMSSTFSSIKDYYSVISSNQEKMVEDESIKIVAQFEELDELEEGISYPEKDEVASQLAASIEEIKTRSLLVYLNDRVEYYLGRLCKAIKAELRDNISYSDFYGTPVEKTNRYFRHLKRSEIQQEHIEIFSELQMIRNCIVHCNGRISECKDKRELERIVGLNIGISSNNGEISIDSSYLKSKIEQVTKSIFSIYKDNGWGEWIK